MRLTYEAYGEKVVIESDNDDIVIDQLYDMLRRLLSGAGWERETLDDLFNVEDESVEKTDEEKDQDTEEEA